VLIIRVFVQNIREVLLSAVIWSSEAKNEIEELSARNEFFPSGSHLKTRMHTTAIGERMEAMYKRMERRCWC
jgi:hypothetical protein